jgi:formylmethanofuran dehydrogenase subunit E
MTRILGIILLLVILRLAVKSFSTQLRAAVFGPPSVPKTPPPRAAVAETLVQCAACGTYVAASRALKAGRGDEVFCSEECRRSNPHP